MTVAACLSLAACGGGASSDDATREEADGYLAVADDSATGAGDVSIQLDYDSVEAGGLDPQTATTARSWSLMSLTYDTLVEIGPDFEFDPGLATKWETPNPTTYVFTLRDGVKFSNGRPMTADDVVDSLERLISGQGVWAIQLDSVKSVKATGDNEVTVSLKRPQTAFLATLANTPAAILPMKEIKAGSIDPAKEMVGTGPFVVENHRQDVSWSFARNEHYWDADNLKIDSLDVEIVGQESTRLAAIRDGSADFAFFNNVDSLDLLTGTNNARAVNQQNTDFYTLFVNSQQKGSALANPDVRFALNTALDRQELADVALAGHALPTGVSPTTLPDACKVEDLPSETASADDTEKVLEDAGVDDLNLMIYSSEPALGQLAQVIQQQLEAVGVTVTIDKVDDGTYDSRAFAKQPADFDLALYWFAGYGDASMVSKWWNPEVVPAHAGFMGADPKLNSLIEKAGSTAAGKERAATITDLCARVDQNSEIVPLVTRPSVLGYRTDTLSPTLYSNEGYGNVLRNIVDWRVPAGE
ncbi:ABC transporter substrate-binding protein [Solicola gregarius]|uniref:ABC transporter substrate-binding protein n=1 Tax=Solicola gregarius TaxID=2908642 RepID=A0AA46TJN9_9ACTN|nr:ABC transporter substrate-binding protein [Solicola gregarius]UYM06594.1 ABC transporter substrate-binding protein [Solicola gregarius]